MSQPFHRPYPKGFTEATEHYRKFLDCSQRFMVERGMSRQESQDVLDKVIRAVEGPGSEYCKVIMGLLTTKETTPVNSFTGEPW